MERNDMNLFTLLKKDHRDVEGILTVLLSEREIGGVELQSDLEILQDLLTNHLQLEEQYVYPKMSEVADARNLVANSYREHKEASILVEELIHHALEEGRDAWRRHCEELLRELRHHIREEEERLFPLMSQVLSARDLDTLYRDVTVMREHQLIAKSL